jgi:hypothetical protein
LDGTPEDVGGNTDGETNGETNGNVNGYTNGNVNGTGKTLNRFLPGRSKLVRVSSARAGRLLY